LADVRLPVYLDNSRTTRLDPEVLEAMQPYMLESYGVPGGEFGHRFDEEAADALERSREAIARAINAEPEEIVFTSGGTEANNLAIKGVMLAKERRKSTIITSKIEESSVLAPISWLERQGIARPVYLNVDGEGFVDLDQLGQAVKGASFVTIQHANQEIGTIQDYTAIADLCEEAGVILHCDAVQSFCKEPVDVERMRVDLLSLSAHLIHGPKGVGALYVREGLKLHALMQGDSRERGLRPGTPNLPGIVGFAKAVELMKPEHIQHMRMLRDELMKRLLAVEDTKLNGPRGDRRLCNNVNITFLYVEGEAILMHANMRGLIIGTGSACYSQELRPSHVILAIGGSHMEAHGSTRLTLSKWTTDAEVDYAVETLSAIVEKLRRISPLYRKKLKFEEV